MVIYYIKVIQIQAYDSEECRNLRKFILKLHSELNVFNLGGSVFQDEDPEKAKLVLNCQYEGTVKHSYLIHTGQELDEESHSDKRVPCQCVFST